MTIKAPNISPYLLLTPRSWAEVEAERIAASIAATNAEEAKAGPDRWEPVDHTDRLREPFLHRDSYYETLAEWSGK